MEVVCAYGWEVVIFEAVLCEASLILPTVMLSGSADELTDYKAKKTIVGARFSVFLD